jgi:hypothetical protein
MLRALASTCVTALAMDFDDEGLQLLQVATRKIEHNT